jgi:6-phosphogluconolactonase (cycloisomerase 2 family)
MLAGTCAVAIEGPDSVQNLAPPNSSQRFEGLAFSSSGNTLGVATSDTNTIFLFRRKPDGRFEDAPYCAINGPGSRLNYPHDLSFSSWGDSEMLAVAQRAGSISIYERHKTTDRYSIDPAFELRGPATRLNYTDGVAFVPPDNEYLAACNLRTSTISFYRKIPCSRVVFEPEPVFELRHRVYRPDGIAFSQCGEWLAVANHGNHTVSIYRRRQSIFSRRQIKYGRTPVTLIKDPGFRYPHSVAFTPGTNHLVVTNAGANYFSIYEPKRDGAEMRWSQAPVIRKIVGPDSIFQEVNARNKMEGGPKGVAIYKDTLAVCSPEHGIKIYSLRETVLHS